jgi:uncharacterized protein (TIGR03083 family)
MADIDWAAEYAAARARIRIFLDEAGEAVADAPVAPCPGWTVRHVLAHVTGLAVALASGRGPGGADLQAWLDGLVDERADRTLDELLTEWAAVGPAIDAYVAGMGAGGGQLVYDVIAHEHDIRLAAGRPGARASSGVVACAAAASMLLARDLATHGLAAVRVTSGGRTWDIGEGAPGLEVELEPFELIRVLGSRRSEAQLRAIAWRGDLDRYLPALAHLPLPADDIVE